MRERAANTTLVCFFSFLLYIMANVIVTSPDELRAMISEAIQDVLPKLANFRRKNEQAETDNLTVEQAVLFLNEQGYPVKRETLYNLTFKKQIPYRKVGRRVVFSKRELLEWVENYTTRPNEAKEEAALLIAKSANRKS